MVIVVVIIGTFFAISTPLFSRFIENAKLDMAARSVASALKVARSHAITQDADCFVVFDTASTPNEYFDSFNGVDPVEKKYKLSPGIWFYKPGSADPVADAVEFAGDVASFKPTGELDEPTDKAVCVSDGTDASARSKTVTVERTTGNLKIE